MDCEASEHDRALELAPGLQHFLLVLILATSVQRLFNHVLLDAGWLVELRIYSSGCLASSEHQLEELHEADLSAKSPKKGQDTRFSQAHEHGRWTQDHRRPAPART